MKKLIKTLRKKLKSSQKLNSKLKYELMESHSDIIILDQTNHHLEQENLILTKKITDFEEVYLKDTKTAFEKQLQHIMSEVRDIKKEDSSFYSNAFKYLYGYIQALEQYSNDDTKKIMKKIEAYKRKVHETQKYSLSIKHQEKTIFKKFDKVSFHIKELKNKIKQNCT